MEIDAGGVSFLPEENAPSPASQAAAASSSLIDPERVDTAIEAAISQLTNNMVLMKYKLLSTLGAPLSEVEQRSIIVGIEQDPDRRKQMQEELSLLHDVIASKLSSGLRRNRSMGSMKSSGFAGGNAVPCASANMLGTLTDVLKDHIDGTFRFAFEELTLRITSNKLTIEKRLGPQKTLNKAIERQRDLMAATLAENEALRKECEFLKEHTQRFEGSVKRKEDIHKQRLNAFLREIALIKEQLYRANRDAEYKPVNIDLMPPLTVTDEEESADINIDTLLQYRKTVKEVELEVTKLRQMLKLKEDELVDKEQLIGMIQEKARAREVMAIKAKAEIDQLNSLSMELQGKNTELTNQVQDLSEEVAKLKATKPVMKDCANTAAIDQDEADEVVFVNGTVCAIKNETKAAILKAMDKLKTDSDASTEELAATKATLQREREEASSKRRELEERVEYAERMMKEFEEAAIAAKARQEDAEARAADFANTSAGQAGALAAELSKAQNAVVILRSQNAALCQAFSNVSERLAMLKTRAGLVNYKKRSNEHHIKRAEAAIQQAKEKIVQVEAKCKEQVEAARQLTAIAQHGLTFAQEDALLAERRHASQLAELTRRTQQVEQVSAALLHDYDRLRAEHLKLNSDRMEQLVSAPIDVSQPRVGSASHHTRPRRQGSADRHKGRPSSGSSKKDVWEADDTALSEVDRQAIAVTKYASRLVRLSSVQSRLADAPREQAAHLVVGELRRHAAVLLLRLQETVGCCSSLERAAVEHPEESHVTTWDALHALVAADRDLRAAVTNFHDTLSATKLIPPEELILPAATQDLPKTLSLQQSLAQTASGQVSGSAAGAKISARGAAAGRQPSTGSQSAAGAAQPPLSGRDHQRSENATPAATSRSDVGGGGTFVDDPHLFDAFAVVRDEDVLPPSSSGLSASASVGTQRRVASGGSPARRSAKWIAAQRAFPAPLAPLPAPTCAVSQYQVLPDDSKTGRDGMALAVRNVLDVEQLGPFGDHQAVDRQYSKMKSRLDGPQVEPAVPRWKQFKEQRKQL
jgi:hypothetical protein